VALVVVVEEAVMLRARGSAIEGAMVVELELAVNIQGRLFALMLTLKLMPSSFRYMGLRVLCREQ
jgi:hypothetical protein